MKAFCRLFWKQEPHDVETCPQCKAAWDEVQREEKIMAEVEGPLYHRTDLEKAALDHRGQP
jgi:hypothetical protein